jgi:superfamily II RNA helicase
LHTDTVNCAAVALPTLADIELSFYEAFFFRHGLEPYPVQEKAFAHIFAGESLLVTVPTGTGKTLIAKAAIHKALALGQRAIYTTPLRALTEEKHRELCSDFGEDRVIDKLIELGADLSDWVETAERYERAA